MTNKQMIAELKDLQKDRKTIGADLALWRLLNLLIAYFKEKGGELE